MEFTKAKSGQADCYTDDELHSAFMEIIRGGPETSEAPEGRYLTKDEFLGYWKALSTLLSEMISQLKTAPVVNISPVVEARIIPHTKTQTVSRDNQGRLTGIQTEVE